MGMVIGLSGGSSHGPDGGPPFRLDPRFLQERVGALLEAMLVGRRPAGLTTEDMDTHCPVMPRPAEEEEGCCPICLEASNPGEEVRKLPCGHLFHRQCCEAWLAN